MSYYPRALAGRSRVALKITPAFGAGRVAQRAASIAVARQAARDGLIAARRGPIPTYISPRAYRGRTRTGGFSAPGSREVNFLDTVVTNSVVSTTVSAASGTLVLLNGMAQGTTASTRLGRKICIKSIQLRGSVGAGTTTGITKLSVCLVYDKQSNGAAPSWQDVWDNSTALGANSPYAMRNLSNADRFIVLWYQGYTIVGNQTPGQVTDKSFQDLEHFRRCNLEVHYNAGSAGNVGDIQTGGLFLMMCGDQASGTAAGNADVTTRIRYTD